MEYVDLQATSQQLFDDVFAHTIAGDFVKDSSRDWLMEEDDVSYMMNVYACDHTDVYYRDLEYWLEAEIDSWEYLTRAIKEQIVNVENYSFGDHLAVAQSLGLSEKLQSYIDDVMLYFAYQYMIWKQYQLTREQLDDLIGQIAGITTYHELVEMIDEFMTE